MNKKIIIISLVGLSVVIAFYLLIRELQYSNGNIDELKAQVILLEEENEELRRQVAMGKDDITKLNDELNATITSLAENQDALEDVMAKNEASEQLLLECMAENEALSYPDEASIYLLKAMGVDDHNVLADSLMMLGEEIIGYEGVLGGTMHFVKVRILTDQWAFGRFEDGHYGGYGIYRFEIIGDEINWHTVVEYTDN